MIKVKVTASKIARVNGREAAREITVSAENNATAYATDTMKMIVCCVENACAAMGLEVNE